MWNRLLISPPSPGLRTGRPKKRAYALRVPAGLCRAIPVAALLGLLGPRLAAQTSAPVPVLLTLVNRGQTIHINADAVVTVRGDAVNGNEGTFTNNGTLSLTGNWQNQDGGTFTNHTNGTLTVMGDAINSNGCILTNKGMLSLTGNWTNGGSYNGNGTLKLVGGPQTITHSPNGGKQTIGTLVLDGQGEKRWINYTEILDTLVLQKGVITLGANAQIFLSDTVFIRGGSPASYVSGPLFHRGTEGKKFFPIGKEGAYLPVELDQVNGTKSVVVGMEAFLNNAGATLGKGTQWVSTGLHWRRTSLPGPGTFSGAFVTLHYGSQARVTDRKDLIMNDMIVAEASQLPGSYQSAGGVAISGTASEGSVTSKDPVTGSYFTVGTSDGKALPAASTMYIPNTFSPSAANPEEKVWKIYGSQLETEGFLLRIYNRWGNLIYENASLAELTQRGWDGRNPGTGKVESGGVYTYTVSGKLIGGAPFQKIGSIQLIP